MAETKTLSKVETFALRAARERAVLADAEFRAIIDEVAAAHGIDAKGEGNDWQFSPDFLRIVYAPAPKPTTGPPESKEP